MTTVAYRDGIMAQDSLCCTASYVNCGQVQKIWRVPAGLLGLCGSLDDAMVALEWIRAGMVEKDRPTVGDMEALLVRPDGAVFHTSKRLRFCEIRAPYHAVGSGYEVALGAMCIGASAVEAVRAACHLDVYSREPVSFEPLIEAAPRLPLRTI